MRVDQCNCNHHLAVFDDWRTQEQHKMHPHAHSCTPIPSNALEQIGWEVAVNEIGSWFLRRPHLTKAKGSAHPPQGGTLQQSTMLEDPTNQLRFGCLADREKPPCLHICAYARVNNPFDQTMSLGGAKLARQRVLKNAC
jgi:hypothetical protein